MYTLGLDVSSRAIGWAVLRKDELIASGAICVKTPGFEDRLFEIANRLKIIILKNNTIFDLAAIERPVFVKNIKATAMIHQVVGAVRFVCRSMGIRLIERSPAEWKAAIGRGSDKKEQVRDTLIAMGYKFTTCMDDETDAIGVALGHYYMTMYPEEFEKPEPMQKKKKEKKK
jgi:Holliday junction resolvasome RuvABC endonuclease subunit